MSRPRDAKTDRQKEAPAHKDAPPPTRAAWSMPISLADLPEAGRRFELKADPASREAVAKVAGAVALPRLDAAFDVTPVGRDSVRVSGTVSATVEQNCVVTLEPIVNEVETPVDLVFVPQDAATAATLEADPVIGVDAADPPEVLHGNVLDLGAVATEFLLLGIDPYPRKPGATFETAPSKEDAAARPFAALAALKKDFGPKAR